MKELDIGNIQAYGEYLEEHSKNCPRIGKTRPMRKEKTNIESRMYSAFQHFQINFVIYWRPLQLQYILPCGVNTMD